MSYNSKYTGAQVEEFLDQIANGEIGGGGGVVEETDPVFSASPAASITEDKISSWDAKLEGKSVMSTEASPSFPQVLFVPQELTEEQKAIARANIGVDSFVADMVNTAINSSY